MKLGRTLVAMLALFGSHCAKPSGNAADNGGPPPPPLAATGAISLDPPATRSPSIVRSVTASFSVIGVTAASDFDVEFTMPSGLPYEKRIAPLIADPFNLQQLQFVLPVAGTFIDSNDLTGTWQVSLRLGGNVLTTQTFELAR